jgi:hypothetical protein
MRFVLEESSWLWDGSDKVAYIERIEQLLDRLDVARERDEDYAASGVLLEQTIFGPHKLLDLFWDQGSPLALPTEVRQRIDALFQSMPYWDEAVAWPAIEVRIDGREVVSPSAALAHQRVSAGEATACVSLPGTWEGPREVVVEGRAERVHFVVDEPSHRAFFRNALDVERVNEASLPELARHAFPDLFFLEGVWDGIRHFEGGYPRVQRELHRFLARLDDHGASAFTTKPVTNQLIERRFHEAGLDVAPEKPNVHNDKRCREARECVLRGKTLYCEWHFKFQPYVNRAHMHPPVPESGGRVIVAIFRDHLPLPGDK